MQFLSQRALGRQTCSFQQLAGEDSLAQTLRNLAIQWHPIGPFQRDQRLNGCREERQWLIIGCLICHGLSPDWLLSLSVYPIEDANAKSQLAILADIETDQCVNDYAQKIIWMGDI